MARHSAHRFETGHAIATLSVSLLSATRKSNALEKKVRQHIADAAGYVSKGDSTELSRRHVFGHACAARALADVDQGKYSAALATFGDAMAEYATGQAPDYIPALEKARKAVDAAREANR
jgi:hypothetical protein